MTEHEANTRRKDVKDQVYESARCLMAVVGRMVDSGTPWQRDAFFHEAMTHLADTHCHLIRWHETVCNVQGENWFAPAPPQERYPF